MTDQSDLELIHEFFESVGMKLDAPISTVPKKLVGPMMRKALKLNLDKGMAIYGAGGPEDKLTAQLEELNSKVEDFNRAMAKLALGV